MHGIRRHAEDLCGLCPRLIVKGCQTECLPRIGRHTAFDNRHRFLQGLHLCQPFLFGFQFSDVVVGGPQQTSE